MLHILHNFVFALIGILAIPAVYSAYVGYTVSNNQERKIQILSEHTFQDEGQWKDISIGHYTPSGFAKEIYIGNSIIRTAFTAMSICLILIIALLTAIIIHLNRALKRVAEV